MEIIECVPNISEGKDEKTITNIANVIRNVEGVHLLNIDSGKDANRTVYTFVGFPEAVLEAAFQIYKYAVTHISMENHKGKHPRMGIVDVCPLIPIRNTNIEKVVEYANKLAYRVGTELEIPVYLYEANATQSYRTRLEQIRAGEYEKFAQKIQLYDWKPDYGPQCFNPITGVTAIGARNYLIAYNVNLSTKNVEIAKNIAAQIRESGGSYTDPQGIKHTKKPGLLQGVKSIGWYIDDFDMVQVSTNITNFKIIGLARVYEEVQKLAQEYGIDVCGSELIGLVPHDALLEAGMYFQHKHHIVNKDALESVVEYLGLNTIKSFDKHKQILEFVARLQLL